MKKNVVLFLTTPNSPSRAKLCLENFKQLEKLGCDIITLTTTDFLPEYIYENSKFVIHDYNEHKCTKKYYYNYYKKTSGLGYFFWDSNNSHTVRFFQDTHFPSLIRHTRTLIHFAKVLLYENYFFVEDDHFFHDDDLCKITQFFEKLNENDMIVFSFRRDGPDMNETEYVYCTWFHFGKLEKSNVLFKNFAYTSEDFIKNEDLYLHFYEYTFKKIIYEYKTPDLNLFEITKNVSEIFEKSSLNKIYSASNIDDDVRCNIIYDAKNNRNVLYYKGGGLNQSLDIKVYIGDNLIQQTNLPCGCWYYLPIENSSMNQIKVLLNGRIVKNFKNLRIDEIVYNGEMV